jgi:two-component sensor histidine kinase
MAVGDEARWKDSDFDDSEWQLVDLTKNKQPHPKSGIFWLRTKVQIEQEVPATESFAFYHSIITSAYELYWDGQLIQSNGKVGAIAEDEIPGKVTGIAQIPQELVQPGDHLLALRISNHYLARTPLILSLKLGTYDGLLKSINSTNRSVFFIIAVFLTATMFNLILYFGFNRKIAYLFFSLYCIAHALKIGLKPHWLFSDIDFVAYRWNLEFVYVAVILGGFFLVAFLISEFVIPRKNFLLATLAGFCVLSYFFLNERIYLFASITFAILVSIYAVWRKMDGSILSLIGLAGFSVLTYLGYQDILNFGYFVGIMFFILCMALSIGRQVAKQNRMREEAMLKSSRLENQLLKKNIQPHFIMNSLTSLQELLEQDPHRASEFIEALADEFRIFSKISSQKLIPIEDELSISKAHLRIMEFRKEAKFTLESHGISGHERVPPAIFHTLIENGLTHGYGKKKSGRFVLSKERINNGTRFKLFNDSEASAPDHGNANGTGLKYVEARLEESYPGRWKLDSAPVERGWTVTIEIYDHNAC